MNRGVATTKKAFDVIDVWSYNAGYTAGYSDANAKSYEEGYRACQEEYKKRMENRKQKKTGAKQRRLYFLKQKLSGVFLLAITILTVKLLNGDATIALFTIPIALVLIFSKGKCWVDNYYFKTHSNEGKSK